ncbi:hypothetical protein JCM10449v2_001118 [Rhodotorula kratochvilovae]
MTPHKRSLAHADSPTAAKRRKSSAPVLDLTRDDDDNDDEPRAAKRWIAPWDTLFSGFEHFRSVIAAGFQPSPSPSKKVRRANGSARPSPDQSQPLSREETQAARQELRQLKKKRLELLEDYTWDKMKAKAANDPIPSKPQSILDLEERMQALRLRLKTEPKPNGVGAPNGDASGSAPASSPALSGQGYKRRKPMGSDKHKRAIAQRDAHTLAELRTQSPQTARTPRSRIAYAVEPEEEDEDDAPEAEDDLAQQLYAERIQSGLLREQAKHDATSRLRPSQRTSHLQIGRSTASIAGRSYLDGPSRFPSATSFLHKSVAPGARPAAAKRTKSDVDRVLAMAKKSLGEPIRSAGSAFERFEELGEALKVANEKAQELEVVKAKKRKFPKELPPADAARVKAVLADSRYESSITGAAASNRDLRRLKGQGWLNDELINFVGVLINRRSDEADKTGERGEGGKRLRKAFVFNTNFFTWYGDHGFAKVKRWTRRFDTFDKDIIIVPINHNNSHWCCAAINIKLKRFEYYDSFGTPAEFVYERLRNWLAEEHRNRKKSEIDLSEWTDYWLEDVPQQNNISDCGVFTCMFMESLSREVDFFDFSQKNMPYLREKMVLQIDKHDLLDVEPWV